MPSDHFLETEYPSPRLSTEISPGIIYVPDTQERDKLLSTGEYVSIEDFRLAGEALGAKKATPTYTFNQLAYVVAECFGDPLQVDSITEELFYGALNRYNSSWKTGNLLLAIQRIQEIAEGLEKGNRIRGIARKCSEVISMVLRDDLSLVDLD